jgi:REP element-mobilizing transposase RayT
MESQLYADKLHCRAAGRAAERTTFHVRIRVSDRQEMLLTEPSLASRLIASARRQHDLGHWWCELFLLMPDHLHAILGFTGQTGTFERIHNWKRHTARSYDIRWQGNFFDQPLRQRNEADAAWWYVRHNPVAKGLCEMEEDWPFWWSALSPMS